MKSIFAIFKNFPGLKRTYILFYLLLVTLYFTPLHSFAQEPAWGTQAKNDSLDAREKRAVQKFLTEFDRWLINDFARVGMMTNTLVKTSPFLQYPAMNPELGAYLSTFERETGTTVILRAYIDIDYFNPWVAIYRGSQKTRKAFEISKAKPAHAVIDIAYSPTGMKSKYEVAGYSITVRDSLRTPAFREIFGEEDFIRMRDTLQAAMGSGPVQGVDSAGFNAAVIRALEALKGDPKTKPDPGYKVTFRKGEAKGYDAYRYPALRKHYHTDNAGNPVSWLSISIRDALTLQGRYEVKDTEAAKETLINIEASDLTAGGPQVKDTILTQALRPAGETREVDITANYFRTNRFGKGTETVAGQVALAIYKEKEMNLVVVLPADSRNNIPQVDAKKLESYLDEVYRPALVSWKVRTETLDYDYPATLEVDSERAKYSAGMNAMIKAFKKQKGVESKTCYVFLVPGLSGGATTGFMPFKGQCAFVTSSGDIFHTIAHELGHGPFRLRHTFSQEGYVAGQGTTDNLMDYTTGNKTILYKHQWDLVHDPETMLFAGREDADEVLDIQRPVSGTAYDVKKEGWESYAFLNPAGIPLLIKDVTHVGFNEDGAAYIFWIGENQYRTLYNTDTQEFYGYVASGDEAEVRKLIEEGKTDECFKKCFHQYSLAPKGSTVVSVSRLRVGQYYKDCIYKAIWEITKPVDLSTKYHPPFIPDDANRTHIEGAECIAVTESDVIDGAGKKLYSVLATNPQITDIKRFQILADSLSTLLSPNKSFAFYYDDKFKGENVVTVIPNNIIEFFEEKQIFSTAQFRKIFPYTCNSNDCEFIFSNVNLWDGIDREKYNINSIDYTTFSLATIQKEEDYQSELEYLLFLVEDLMDSNESNTTIKNFLNEVQTSLSKFQDIYAHQPFKPFDATLSLKTVYATLGFYNEYNYKYTDLVRRQLLKDFGKGNFFDEILKFEAKGWATAIDGKNGVDQYVAQYNTTSSFFHGTDYVTMMDMASPGLNVKSMRLSRPNSFFNTALQGRMQLVNGRKNTVLTEKLNFDLRESNLTAGKKANSIVIRNTKGESIAIVYKGTVTYTKLSGYDNLKGLDESIQNRLLRDFGNSENSVLRQLNNNPATLKQWYQSGGASEKIDAAKSTQKFNTVDDATKVRFILDFARNGEDAVKILNSERLTGLYKSFANEKWLSGEMRAKYIRDISTLGEENIIVLEEVIGLRIAISKILNNTSIEILSRSNVAFATLTYTLQDGSIKSMELLSISGNDLSLTTQLQGKIKNYIIVPPASSKRHFKYSRGAQDSEAKMIEYIMNTIRKDKDIKLANDTDPSSLNLSILDGSNVKIRMSSEMEPCKSCENTINNFNLINNNPIQLSYGTKYTE